MKRPKPSLSILDPAFKYTDSANTSVARTWARFGWKPGKPEQLPQPRTVVALRLKDRK